MTVATDLATATGKRRRAFLKIAGHETILWQRVVGPDGSARVPGRTHPHDSDIIARWAMDGADNATETDATGNGHDASATPNYVLSEAGLFGTARSFKYDGTANYRRLYAADAAALRPAAITIAYWMYVGDPTTHSSYHLTPSILYKNETDAPATAYNQYEVEFRRSAAFNNIYYPYWNLQLDNAGTRTGWNPIGQISGSTLYSREVNEEGWHHFGLTYDGAGTANLYIDGVLEITRTHASLTDLYYGSAANGQLQFSNTNDSWPWPMDDTAMYSSAKSEAWMRSVYENGLNCLELKTEWSHSLDLAEMVVKGSNMTFQLVDIDDPADAGKSYFGKLFAPGRFDSSSAKSTFLRRKTVGYAERQVDADDTVMYVTKTDDYDNMPTTGEAHIGTETFSYTGKSTDALGDHGETLGTFTGVTKGLYPAFSAPRGAGTTTFGYTYQYPPSDDAQIAGVVEGAQLVSDVPYSWMGRHVGLYMTTWDDANSRWFGTDDAELVWAGRIADSIHYDPRQGWQLQCRSILDDLKKELCSSMPTALGRFVNLNGDAGQRFIVAAIGIDVNNNEYIMAYCEIELTAGYWWVKGIAQEITEQINDVSNNWYRVSDGANWVDLDGYMDFQFVVHAGKTYFSATINAQFNSLGGFRIYPAPMENAFNYDDPKRFTGGHPCHALSALGFDTDIDYHRLPIDCTGTNGFAKMTAPNPAQYIYQPVHRDYNGGKCLVNIGSANDIWDTQGDYSADWAVLMARKAMPAGWGGEEARYYAAYTAKSAIDSSVTIRKSNSVTFTYEAMELTLASGVHELAHWDNDARYGFTGGTGGGTYPIEYQQVYVPKGFDSSNHTVGPFKQLLYPLLSTGTTDYNDSDYDECPHEISISFPSGLVDIDSFTNADKIVQAALPSVSARLFTVVDKATSWIDLYKREAQLFGYVLAWEQGKIRVKSVYSPELQSRTQTLDESNTHMVDDYPTIEMGVGTVINVRSYEINHDVNTGKKTETFVVRDVASVQGLGGTTKEMKIVHPGVRLMYRDADHTAFVRENLVYLAQAQGHFTRYPWHQVHRGLAPTLLNKVFVADIVTLVYSTGYQDPFGSGDKDVNALAIVLDVSWNFATLAGSCDLLVYSRYDATQVTPWAPSALVDITASNAGWDTANDRLTLSALEYGIAGDPDDGSAFAASDKLTMFERNHRESDLTPPNQAATGPFAVTVGASGYDADNQWLYVDSATATALDATFDTTGATEYVIVPADWGTAVTAQESLGLWQADKQTHLLNSADDPQRYG